MGPILIIATWTFPLPFLLEAFTNPIFWWACIFNGFLVSRDFPLCRFIPTTFLCHNYPRTLQIIGGVLGRTFTRSFNLWGTLTLSWILGRTRHGTWAVRHLHVAFSVYLLRGISNHFPYPQVVLWDGIQAAFPSVAHPSTRETESLDSFIANRLLFSPNEYCCTQRFLIVNLDTKARKSTPRFICCVGINP